MSRKHTILGTPLTQAVAGTRDFLPPQHAVLKYIHNQWDIVSKRHGFQSYETPIVEQFELFQRKMAANEDLANQMFVWRDEPFKLDKNKDSEYNSLNTNHVKTGNSANYVNENLESPILCLRPEMTPSLARLVMQQGKTLMKPLKYYCIAQCWRNEQVTRGRKREHYQWNCDIWGISEIYAEAELLSVMYNMFHQVGLSNDIIIKFSSRKLLQSLLSDLQSKDFLEVCCIIDRIEKIEPEEIERQLREDLKLPENIVQRIFNFVRLDIKNLSIKEALQTIENTVLNSNKNNLESFKKASEEILQLYELAEAYGYNHILKFDPSIVRGLSYYTGIVFEAFSTSSGLQRAICGGGRYDNLLKDAYDYVENIPAVGFGFGDIVLTEILQEKQLIPKDLTVPFVDNLVIPFDDSMRIHASNVAQLLRSSNPDKLTDIYLGNTNKLKSMFNYADRVGAERVVLVAPEEWKKGVVRIKYLREENRPQFDVPLKELASFKYEKKAIEQV